MIINTAYQALLNMWATIIGFIPNFMSAIVVLVFGLLVASGLGHLASRLTRIFKLDDILTRIGFTQKAAAYGVHFSISRIVRWLVKWFFITVVLIVVAQVLGWVQVTSFLQAIALYIPNVLIAVVILTVGLIAGQFIHNVVEQTIKTSKAPTAAGKPLAAVAKWAIIMFTAMAALSQLGVATRLIEILFTGLVMMLALAGGLAFGIGGKDRAAHWLEAIEREFSRRQ